MCKIKSFFFSLIFLGTISSQLFSCGYLMHPERRGQKGGEFDASVVGLDTLGFLFFAVPGGVALGIDIYEGTIYLPEETEDPEQLAAKLDNDNW